MASYLTIQCIVPRSTQPIFCRVHFPGAVQVLYNDQGVGWRINFLLHVAVGRDYADYCRPIQGGPKKLHTAFFAIYNFAYSQSIFIIFGTYTLWEICNWVMHS